MVPHVLRIGGGGAAALVATAVFFAGLAFFAFFAFFAIIPSLTPLIARDYKLRVQLQLLNFMLGMVRHFVRS
jgi:hypothetical protein